MGRVVGGIVRDRAELMPVELRDPIALRIALVRRLVLADEDRAVAHRGDGPLLPARLERHARDDAVLVVEVLVVELEHVGVTEARVAVASRRALPASLGCGDALMVERGGLKAAPLVGADELPRAARRAAAGGDDREPAIARRDAKPGGTVRCPAVGVTGRRGKTSCDPSALHAGWPIS